MRTLRTLPRRTVVIGAVVLVVVVAVIVVLVVRANAGPSSPGEVTFGAAGARVEVDASQFCDLTVTTCGADPQANGVLRVPPSTPLAIEVPDAVSSTPWQVAFTFRDGAGGTQQGRSPVFGAGTTPRYTLILPTPTAQLESAEVQQYGARISQGSDGIEFATRATWVLSVDDR